MFIKRENSIKYNAFIKDKIKYTKLSKGLQFKSFKYLFFSLLKHIKNEKKNLVQL